MEMALLCLRQHGGSATYYAATRADERLEAGDTAASKFWRTVATETEKMLQEEPKGMKQ